jgi:hypothetical protein
MVLGECGRVQGIFSKQVLRIRTRGLDLLLCAALMLRKCRQSCPHPHNHLVNAPAGFGVKPCAKELDSMFAGSFDGVLA